MEDIHSEISNSTDTDTPCQPFRGEASWGSMTNPTVLTPRNEEVDLVFGIGDERVTVLGLKSAGELFPVLPLRLPEPEGRVRFAGTVRGLIEAKKARAVVIAIATRVLPRSRVDLIVSIIATVARGLGLPAVELPDLELLSAEIEAEDRRDAEAVLDDDV
jgi:hypothetical protein